MEGSLRLPKKINILGRNYTIEYFDFNGSIQTNTMCGTSGYSGQKIQIDSKSHRESQESVLLHEIIHQVSHSMKLDLSEETVCQLEAGLYQVLKDNDLLK
jgi:hypothetical protein